MKQFLPPALLCLVLALVVCAADDRPAAANPAPRFVEELSISVDQGSLEIVDTAQTNIAVEAFRLDEGVVTREPAADENARLRHEQDTLSLKFSSRGKSGMIYRVHVPHELPLNLKSSLGHITITNHDGAVRISSSVGQVRLGRIHGDLFVNASAGDVFLERADSDVRVKVSGGSMVLDDIAGAAVLEAGGGSISVREVVGEILAKASGGSVTVLAAHNGAQLEALGGSVEVNFTAQPKGESVLHASGGSVQLGVPPELNLRLAARGDGELESELPVDWRDTFERYRRGLLNKEGATVTLRADGGRVHLMPLPAEAAPAARPFKVKPLISSLADLRGAMPTVIALAQNNPATGREAKPPRDKPKDAPSITRNPNVWQNADWKPVAMLPRGVVRRDGQWVEAEITALSDYRVTFRKTDGTEENVKLDELTAVVFQPVPETRKPQIEGHRRGALLKRGDFIPGELSHLGMNEVTVSSVLFGLKKFNTKTDVSAVVVWGE